VYIALLSQPAISDLEYSGLLPAKNRNGLGWVAGKTIIQGSDKVPAAAEAGRLDRIG
jgi:hypothetical protein